jgi:hypothetical protein
VRLSRERPQERRNPGWPLPGWPLPGWPLPGWPLPGWPLPGWPFITFDPASDPATGDAIAPAPRGRADREGFPVESLVECPVCGDLNSPDRLRCWICNRYLT